MWRLWIDDLRPPPEDWIWAKTSEEAIGVISVLAYYGSRFSEASFDHDLGGDDTTRPVILWLCEQENLWPDKIYVHSANPVGVEWLQGMVNRYGPGITR